MKKFKYEIIGILSAIGFVLALCFLVHGHVTPLIGFAAIFPMFIVWMYKDMKEGIDNE